MNNQDYYELLGVARTATSQEIVQAFRSRAMALHPDRNIDKPEAATHFKLISQAYHTLTDPVLRIKYDATLPEKTASAPRLDFTLEELWNIVGKLYLDRTPRYTKAVDGLQKSKPIVIDEESGLLIVGLEAVNSNLLGYLESIEVHNNIKDIITEVYGKPMDFRIITGTTQNDYLQLKEAEERLKKRKKATAIDLNNISSLPELHSAKPQTTSKAVTIAPVVKMTGIWEELVGGIDSAWATTSQKELPQVKAEFALKQLPALAQQAKLVEVTEDSETVQRSVGQILEHIAILTGISSEVLGMEYVRYVMRLTGIV